MSWLFSQALVVEYLGEKSSDGEPFAPLNVMPTQHPFWRNDKTIDFSPSSQFGLTSKHLTENLGLDVLTSFLADFPVRTSARQEKEPESMVPAVAYGRTWQELFLRYDLHSSGWKTHHCLLEEEVPESSVILPQWGTMRSGVLWELVTPPLPTLGKESGFLPTPTTTQFLTTNAQKNRPTLTLEGMARTGKWIPTPTVSGNHNRPGISQKSGIGLASWVRTYPTPTACNNTGGIALCKWGGSGARKKLKTMVTPEELNGPLNPDWVEWLMGWPTGWTALKPLATARYHEWWHWHGTYLTH